ncbi:MAG: ATP-grasp domain-containing protein [bacterium]|nr:ATP-grasp domain-containing protein [bacterium]
MKKNILVMCPVTPDQHELSLLQSNYHFIFHTYDENEIEKILVEGTEHVSETFDPGAVIDYYGELCAGKVDGVISTDDYPGSIFASVVGKKLGLRVPDVQAVLCCQHKYYARCAQREVVPEATPPFMIINPDRFDESLFSLSFPVFLKPVKSYFSFFANSAHNMGQLRQLIKHSQMPPLFLQQFNWFLKNYSTYELDGHYLLAEDLLEGEQSTLEGYFCDGIFGVTSIVDSIMFENKISFKRFEYPSHLPQNVQERMADIARRIMSAIGFDNGFFNIEFFYNNKTDQIHIIEINPRIAPQFADLAEKVDGTNTYAHLLSIATGTQPNIEKGKGKHAMSASLVLRIFENKRVLQSPSQQDIECFFEEFPDARIQFFVKTGDKLSDAFQDGKSFRYGLIHLGGRDRQDILEQFERAQQLLPFIFGPV